MAEEHYYLPLYYIYFYIYTIIIISILIFVNAVYNIIVYINIILNKYSDDVVLIENNKLSKSKVYDESKLLIGDTVDYKLFISTFIDNHFNYCDKYFTLNITRSLLKLFIIFTIISIVFLFITLLWDWMGKDDIDFNNKKCHEYIIDNCILINNNITVKGYDKLKLAGIAIIIAILFIIFIIDFTIQNTIYVKYIVDWDKDKTELNVDSYRYRNIETYLNTYIDTANSANNNHVLDATNNNNIDMLINHLKGYNIDTIENIKNITNSANDVKYNLFIARVKSICAKIKEKNITQINKDLDFVNLVIIFLNNMKILNDNRDKNIIKGSGFNVYFLSISTIFNDIINVITNIIPVFPGIEKIKDKKIDAYNLYNILIGGIPLSLRENILNDGEDCKDIKYEETISNISTDKETDRKKCIYYNYLYDLKNISKYEPFKHNLKNTLITILSFAILSVIIIILLLIYIYINFSREHVDWSKEISIHLIRSAKLKNLGYLGLGYIIKNLINKE
jgi:hypothetical protein